MPGDVDLAAIARAVGLGAGHGVDIPFVFGDPTSRFAARVLGPAPQGFAELSGRVCAAWTGFAATGDPGWPRYEDPQWTVRVWDVAPRDAADPLAASRRIWQGGPGS